MVEQNIRQILQAFNTIESKLQEQNGVLRELTAKVNALESQNKQLVQLIHQLQSPSMASVDQSSQSRREFQDSVTKSLRSLEDKSRKAIELIKANGGKGKKRAWP